MKFSKTKKILLVLMLGIIAFLINSGEVKAYQTFPDYGMVQGGAYCDYEIYTTNDDSAESTYNGHHLYLVYDGGTIKWVNPNNGNLMNSGDRWDTDGVLKQIVSYDAASLTSALVENGKLTYCPTVYFKEVNNKYNLSISLDPSSVSHGGIEGEGHGIEGKDPSVTELDQPCSYLARICNPGSFVGDALGDLYIHRYSDGSISFNFGTDQFSDYTLNTSGVDGSYFKDGCPKDVFVDCGGVASEGSAYCNVVKESECKYTAGESNGASGHNPYDFPEINKGDKPTGDDTDNSSDECTLVIGEKVRDDIKKIFKWIRIAAPILVLVLGSVDFSKAVFADDPKALSNATSTFVKRLIAAVALFLAPTVIMYLLDIFNSIISQCSFDIRGF